MRPPLRRPPASDFRSDTVTRPTPAMREAMASAEVGDDVLDGDPTVRRLEDRAAEWLGKEDALFVPSGTMANQTAVGVWASRGEEVIVERGAHVLRFEAGALGGLHGLQTVTLEGERGALDPDEVRRAVRPAQVHCPRTALVCAEQTHMGAGGRVIPLARMTALGETARELGLPLHLDGARLPNAVAATGLPAAELAAPADSVSVCLSKGLGAPVGSVVAGDGAFVEAARVVRKRLGGWMRQAGCLAAAGLLGLEEGLARLGEDHELARLVAEAASGRPGLACDPEGVETNIVEVALAEGAGLDGPGLAAALAEHGVGVLALRPDAVRLVTHRDVGRADVERLSRALDAILSG